ncbi:hypothetical protein ACYUT7_21220, partial [Escherichia coli]
LHGDVLMWLMKTLLTSGCTNQRGAGQEDVELRRWRLLRSATLSKERITEEAQRFLEMVYGEE